MAHTVSATVVPRTPLEEATGLITGMDWTLKPFGAPSSLLRARSYSMETLAGQLVFLGVDFTTCEPAELTDQIRALRDRMNRALTVVQRGNSTEGGDNAQLLRPPVGWFLEWGGQVPGRDRNRMFRGRSRAASLSAPCRKCEWGCQGFPVNFPRVSRRTWAGGIRSTLRGPNECLGAGCASE